VLIKKLGSNQGFLGRCVELPWLCPDCGCINLDTDLECLLCSNEEDSDEK